MSVVLTNTVRNAKAAAATDLTANGRIRFLTSGGAQVALMSFGPSAFFAPPIAGQSALVGTLVDSFTAAGTIASFEIQSQGETVLITGTVTGLTGGGDIELAQTTFATGDRLEISSLVYTQPATEPTP
jgi:hypothetical protein